MNKGVKSRLDYTFVLSGKDYPINSVIFILSLKHVVKSRLDPLDNLHDFL